MPDWLRKTLSGILFVILALSIIASILSLDIGPASEAWKETAALAFLSLGGLAGLLAEGLNKKKKVAPAPPEADNPTGVSF